MNPNAKEFVPAHLMRKRQDEAAVGSLAKQLDDVDLDESKRVGEGKGDTSCDNQQNSAETSSRNDKAQDQTSNRDEDTNNKGSADLNKDQNSTPTTTSSASSEQCHKAQHNSYTNQTNERSKNNQEINGGQDEDDRYLLRAGENYCEFNGEQFIIPGEDDEYDTENDNQVSDSSHPVYDFGNPEDNEDENVINAYDEFLSELP